MAPWSVGTISSDCAEAKCELQYGTTPSELFGVSPRPRSPMIELCGAWIGSLSIALKSGLAGERPLILVGIRYFLGSLFGAIAANTELGTAVATLRGSRI